jgi:hypothetical protein
MKTVLVVEDSKLLRVEKEHTLKKAGYSVLTAVDAWKPCGWPAKGTPT